MKIAFLGYGGMGQSAAKVAVERGHSISAIIDSKYPNAHAKELNGSDLNGSEVVVEFTNHKSVLKNIDDLLTTGIPFLIGSTGWYDEMEQVKKAVLEKNAKVLWSSNFSIGVNLYYKIVEEAAKLIDKYDEYDIWGTEIHHHKKSDSPSGTAKILEKILLENISRKKSVVEEKLDRAIKPEEIHFSSTRGGPTNFVHTIGFDSAADTITITHSARSREGYALGAIKAAEWLIKQKPGFYSMQDFLA